MKTILVTGGNGMVGHAFQKIHRLFPYHPQRYLHLHPRQS